MSEKEKAEVSLKEFIDENYKLFAVMGVLGALVTFFTRFEGSELIVVWSFIAFLLVIIELWQTQKKVSNPSWKLSLFIACMLGTLSGVSWYLLLNYWRQVLGIVIPFLIVIPIIYLLVRYRIEEKLKAHRRMYKWLAIILVFILISVIYAILYTV